jgi:recombination protein RecT
MEDRSSKLLQVMPKGMDPERFMRTSLMAVSRNEDLLACTPQSLITAIFEAAEIGIEPTGSLGRGYLVPIKDHGVAKAEFWLGYAGYIDLAMRSGQVSKVWSRPVYEGDKFEALYGTDDRIVHEPLLEGTDPNKITHVYACVQYKDGIVDFEVLTRAQVDAVRSQARGSNSPTSPWVTAYAEQARKTALRKLGKRLPLTPEAATAMERDMEREFGFAEKRTAEHKTEKRTLTVKDKLRGSVTPQDAPESEVAPTPTPDVSAPQHTAAADVEVVEGELVEEVVCEGESPYEDGALCTLSRGHKGFHRGGTGATWGRGK